MREIKFRVFDGTNIHYINHEEGLQIAFGSHHQSYSVWNEYEEVIDGDQEVSVLMQYTGLKDKNGTEIYEGDVVKQSYEKVIDVEYDMATLGYVGHEDISGDHTGEVVITATKGACLRNPIHYSDDEDKTEKMKMYKPLAGYRCEVIGNIYDNPELVKEDSP